MEHRLTASCVWYYYTTYSTLMQAILQNIFPILQQNLWQVDKTVRHCSGLNPYKTLRYLDYSPHYRDYTEMNSNTPNGSEPKPHTPPHLHTNALLNRTKSGYTITIPPLNYAVLHYSIPQLYRAVQHLHSARLNPTIALQQSILPN